MSSEINKRKKRILWANGYCLLDTSSGASISVREILRQLVKRGYEVEIFGATVFDSPKGISRIKEKWSQMQKGQEEYLLVEDDVLRHHLVKTKSTNRQQMSMNEISKLTSVYVQKLNEFKPDLVMFYGGHATDSLVPLEARLRGIPSAAYLVNANYHGTQWCRDTDVILTDTNATSQHYKEKCGFTPQVIGKFINPEEVIAKSHERKNLTFINPSWEKGAGLVAMLALVLEKKRPDIKIEVVESRGNWTEILSDVSKSISGKIRTQLQNVIVVPHTSDISSIYSRTRILLSPSLWWESGSRVLAEAMMNGIPAIISTSGGNQEMVREAGITIQLPSNCFKKPYNILPTEDSLETLIKLIERLWDDEAFYLSQVNKAVQVGFSYHLMDNSFKKLENTLAPLLNKYAGDNDFKTLLFNNHKHKIEEIIPVKKAESSESKLLHGEVGTIQPIGNNVVRKSMIPDGDSLTKELFKREMDILKKIKDLNLAPKIYKIDEKNLLIDMEQAGCPISEDNYKKSRKNLVDKLKTLKKNNIRHNDLMPENILVNDRNEVSIIDFSWATINDQAPIFNPELVNYKNKIRALYDDDCLSHLDLIFGEKKYDEIHLFILWDKAQEQKATKEISKRNEILLRVSFDKNFYNYFPGKRIEFLNKFYLNKVESHGTKGYNGFILFIVGQKKAEYKEKLDPLSKKTKRVNVATFETKHQIRKGKLGVIHASNNPEEAYQNAAALSLFKRQFPLNIFEQNRPRFSSLSEVFQALNNSNVNYAILRNWDFLPENYKVDDHGDIDILVDDYHLAKKILGGKAYKHTLDPQDPRFGFDIELEGVKVANKVIVCGKEIEFDIRFVGDGYYPKAWQKDMLRRSKKHREIKVLSDGDHFYSLLYHALMHKKSISKTYTEKFMNLESAVIDGKLLKERLSDKNYLWSLLKDFLIKEKLRPSIPMEKNIPFNFWGLNLDI